MESGEDSFDDERDSGDDDDPGYVNQITPDEIERYRNLLELALQEGKTSQKIDQSSTNIFDQID